MNKTKQYEKGLAVNRLKPYIKELPEHKFTAFGKLANRPPADLNHTVQIINSVLDSKGKKISAGELKAVITITEMSFRLIINYTQQNDPTLLNKIEETIKATQGKDNYQSFLKFFKAQFLYYQDIPTLPEHFVLIELILNWLNNINPAFQNFYLLFDNKTLFKTTGNLVIMQEIINCLQHDQSHDHQSGIYKPLYSLLREPALRFPDSIKGQLEYILESWQIYIDDLDEVLHSLDLLKEEEVHFGDSFPPPPILEYSSLNAEESEEYYTDDSDWMPSLVLIAKSTYVWLHQLSLKYGYSIKELDQIPEEEFILLHDRGITGLWLIGIWQRSHASELIKSRNGDGQAIASAYSLESYQIARELGGEAAWQKLSQKALRHGIKLGCDMVPNHTGIDSDWILDHPQWFIQLDNPPYPNYSFHGANLSTHPEIEIRIEDHYYAKTDASVVFELYDKRTGAKRYIYHGNDGTGLPWNDTAQLDYMKKEVRQAVLNEIIKIAQKIHIIRFDAAMTLAKKHYQRLWYPLPGSGGDIPTRSQFSMDKKQFDEFFPREFWRDVVDKVAQEAPDTLLLAEAFWMMEGYFVRNLGMHRVYNSAFMHMMMREDNAAYRLTIKNTLKYDKRILKRFVNFMSNPDEATAIEQFGDDDKYFGVCVMMCTLPGLPMFAHGQIEGLTEKYGMEFASPRISETENSYLVHRHEREIFPLLKHRKLFAEADNFCLFDFYDQQSSLNENVMAYSNLNSNVQSLVVFNNSYSSTEGCITKTAKYLLSENDLMEVQACTLGEELKLEFGQNRFLIFKDMISGYEYLRYCDDVLTQGLFLSLSGYQYHVFYNFKQITDSPDQSLAQVYAQIGYKPVDSIQSMKKRLTLRPLHQKLKKLFSYSMISNQELLISGEINNTEERKFFLKNELFPAICDFHSHFMQLEKFEPWLESRLVEDTMDFFRSAESAVIRHKPACPQLPPSSLIAVWILFREIKVRALENNKKLNPLIDKYLLHEPVLEILHEAVPDLPAQLLLDIVYTCLDFEDIWQELLTDERKALIKLLNDKGIKNIIQLHTYNGKRWFRKEAFDLLATSLEIVNRINRVQNKKTKTIRDLENISHCYKILYISAQKSDYDFDQLIKLINEPREE